MNMKRLLNPKTVAGACLFGATVASSVAFAGVNVPPPIKVDGGPLGQLEISGGYDAMLYAYSGADAGTLYGTNRSSGAANRVLDFKVDKPTGPVRFTIEVKPDTSLYLGNKVSPMSANTFTLGPVYLAYATLAPTPDFTISVGQVGSVEGWESSTDWFNPNIVDSPLYYVENSSSRGVSASYSHGPISATLVFGDGWDTGVFNTFQGLVTYSFDSNNSLSVYGEMNVGTTGPNTYAYGNGTTGYGPGSAYYPNSNMIGAYYSYTHGNLTLIPEIQYVYAKVNHKIGLDKFGSNLGVQLITDYKFGKSPYSLGGQAFYYRNNGPEPWYLNAHSAGFGIGVTPTYSKGHFFVRGEAAMLHLTNLGSGPGYGSGGTDRNTVLGVLEAGFVF